MSVFFCFLYCHSKLKTQFSLTQNSLFHSFHSLTKTTATAMARLGDEFLNFYQCLYLPATTSEQMITEFNSKAGTLNDSELGLASLKIGMKLELEGKDHELAQYYANRAFKAFETQHENTNTSKNSLLVVFALHLIGRTHFEMDRFHTAIGFFLQSNTMVGKMQNEDGLNDSDVWDMLHGLLPDLSRAYIMGENYKEALPFSLKALELHTHLFPLNSDIVYQQAHDRCILASIYGGLGEYAEVLKQDFLAQRIYNKHRRFHSNFLSAKIHAADMMIDLQRYDDATGNYKSILQNKVDKVSNSDRAHAFISMARWYADQGNFEKCKKQWNSSLMILGKREGSSQLEVADAYAKICWQYGVIKEYEAAITLHKRALTFLGMLPKEQWRQGSVSRSIGMLLLLTKKWRQAVPHLESALEKLKYCFGPKHFKVGGIYNSLGEAYLGLRRTQLAIEKFTLAKDIYDASLEPDHVDRIAACENLAKALGKMGSYKVAVEFQKLAIDAQSGHGASASEAKLEEVNRVLEEIKRRASDASAKESSQAFP